MPLWPNSAPIGRALESAPLERFLFCRATTYGDRMRRKDLMAAYRRLGIIIAAFALIAGISAAPLLQREQSPTATSSGQRNEPELHSHEVPTAPLAEKQG